MQRGFLVAAILLASCGCKGRELEAAVDETDYLFVDRMVPRLSIEIPPEGMQTLRNYEQVWRQARPERIDVKATVSEGKRIYKDVAIHLKGSYTFQPINARPSLTLNFGKFVASQQFHGLTKLHLNNTVQDPSYLNEAVARDLFNAIGVATPRAGHALVTLNGRSLGLYVLLEGANKRFLKRHFASTAGNLYDADGGGEITGELDVDSGDDRENRSELTNLAEAAAERDPAKRWARLEELLDVEQFLSFIAGEVLLVHWDGYATGAPNNYRVFHDVSRRKLVFIPHGLDQILGSGAAAQTLRPRFNGLVARAIVTTPEGRRRYLERIATLTGKEFQQEALLRRAEEVAAKVRKALPPDDPLTEQFEARAGYLKANLARRSEAITRLLDDPARPVTFDSAKTAALTGWRFKTSNTSPSSGRKVVVDGSELLQVQGRAAGTAGSWRTQVLLNEGSYEFAGRARAEGIDAATVNEVGATAPQGVILRISGEKFPIASVSPEWTALRYVFEVHGLEDVELVCEFRGQGSGVFDPGSMRLIRLGSASSSPALPK